MMKKEEILKASSTCRNEISRVEYQQDELASELKTLKRALDSNYIAETVSDLLRFQEEKGELDEITLTTFLSDLVSKVKN